MPFLPSFLTSLESGFAIPVVEGPRNHNSAWRRHIFIILIVTKKTHYYLIAVNYLRPARHQCFC